MQTKNRYQLKHQHAYSHAVAFHRQNGSCTALTEEAWVTRGGSAQSSQGRQPAGTCKVCTTSGALPRARKGARVSLLGENQETFVLTTTSTFVLQVCGTEAQRLEAENEPAWQSSAGLAVNHTKLAKLVNCQDTFVFHAGACTHRCLAKRQER